MKLTAKQRVLRKHHGAWACCAYGCAGNGWVIHDGPIPYYSDKKLGKPGRTVAQAWANAAKNLKEVR